MTIERFNALPYSFTVWECKTGRKVLITPLNSAKNAPKSELKLLYKSGWNREALSRDSLLI